MATWGNWFENETDGHYLDINDGDSFGTEGNINWHRLAQDQTINDYSYYWEYEADPDNRGVAVMLNVTNTFDRQPLAVGLDAFVDPDNPDSHGYFDVDMVGLIKTTNDTSTGSEFTYNTGFIPFYSGWADTFPRGIWIGLRSQTSNIAQSPQLSLTEFEYNDTENTLETTSIAGEADAWETDNWYWVRVNAQWNDSTSEFTVRARIWSGDGQDEPDTWDIDETWAENYPLHQPQEFVPVIGNLGAYESGPDHHWTYLGIGTNGDTAPKNLNKTLEGTLADSSSIGLTADVLALGTSTQDWYGFEEEADNADPIGFEPQWAGDINDWHVNQSGGISSSSHWGIVEYTGTTLYGGLSPTLWSNLDPTGGIHQATLLISTLNSGTYDTDGGIGGLVMFGGDFVPNSGSDGNGDIVVEAYYEANTLVADTKEFRLYQYETDGSYTQLGTGQDFSDATRYWIRLEVDEPNSQVRMKTWEEGTDEPTSWDVDVSLAETPNAGWVGFFESGGNSDYPAIDILGIGTFGLPAGTDPAIFENVDTGSSSSQGFSATVSSGFTLSAILATADSIGLNGSLSTGMVFTGTLASSTASGLNGELVATVPVTLTATLADSTATGLNGSLKTTVDWPATLATSTSAGLDPEFRFGEVFSANLGAADSTALQGKITSSLGFFGEVAKATGTGLNATTTTGTVLSATLATADSTGLTSTLSFGEVFSATLAPAQSDGLDASLAPDVVYRSTLATADSTGLNSTTHTGQSLSSTLAQADSVGLSGEVSIRLILDATLASSQSTGLTAGFTFSAVLPSDTAESQSTGFNSTLTALHNFFGSGVKDITTEFYGDDPPTESVDFYGDDPPTDNPSFFSDSPPSSNSDFFGDQPEQTNEDFYGKEPS